MTDIETGTREEWLAARLELLEAEKELTRRSDELARRRQELPWVRIDKEYSFDTEEGTASLADLFQGRSQHLVYHFMFAPEYTAGVSVLLGDRGRLRRLGHPPRESPRHALRGVAGSARETAGVQTADGLELPLGVVVRQRFQLRLPGVAHQGAVAVRIRRRELPQDGLSAAGNDQATAGCASRGVMAAAVVLRCQGRARSGRPARCPRLADCPRSRRDAPPR